jgi:hypothetical protein
LFAPFNVDVGNMKNMGSCRLKGNGRMITGAVWRFVLAGIFMMISNWAANSFAADEPKGPALSKALAEVQLFAGLTEAERDALGSVATLRRGRAGERIIEQGKPSGRMFIILEGQAEVWVNGRQILTLSGQSLVGERGRKC